MSEVVNPCRGFIVGTYHHTHGPWVKTQNDGDGHESQWVRRCEKCKMVEIKTVFFSLHVDQSTWEGVLDGNSNT